MSKKGILKPIRYYFEYVLFMFFICFFRLLPYKISSYLGGKILENIGGLFKASQTIKKNLNLALPDLSVVEQNRIAKGVWNNLGRVFAEFPHLVTWDKKKFDKLVRVEGEEKLADFLGTDKPLIFCSAHYSNWEVFAKYFVFKNMKVNILYRDANNKLVNDKVMKMRVGKSNIKMCKKGVLGAGKAVRSLLKGEVLTSFIDQKLSEGIDVPFFGRNAKTVPLIASLSLKHDIPIIPVHIERDGSNFTLIIEDPIDVKEKKFKNEYQIMLFLNKIMENWIKNKPEEWFWVHNRW